MSQTSCKNQALKQAQQKLYPCAKQTHGHQNRFVEEPSKPVPETAAKALEFIPPRRSREVDIGGLLSTYLPCTGSYRPR